MSPSVAQLIRMSKNKMDTKETIKNLQINEKDWVFYPVSNNNQVNKPGGGTHWSLLVYSTEKDVYYHHDPIYPTNEMHALELIRKISSADSRFSHFQIKIKSPQQKNGYDCGPYIMLFANKIADNLIKGTEPNHYEVSENEASGYRRELKDKIHLEMKRASVELDTKHNRVCYRWINYRCWKGKDCTYDHPDMCEADVNEGHCKKNSCDLYHPQICRANLSYRVCRWGDICKFRHVHDDVLVNNHRDYTYKTTHRRRHQRYPPTRYTKHHTGKYGLPNEHHQNDTNVKFYNRHGNNHRDGADFQLDWSTQREDEILRKLRNVIRMETGNWGTANRRRPRF